MSYSPITVGEAFTLLLTLLLDNLAPLPLTNVQSIVLVFKPVPGSPQTNVRFVATGAVTITDLASGQCSFTPSSLDSARLMAGQWLWQPVVTYVGGAVRYGKALPLEAADPL